MLALILLSRGGKGSLRHVLRIMANRYCEDESASFPDSITVDPDSAAVQLDEAPRKRQAKPRSLPRLPRIRQINLFKRRKDTFLVLRFQSHSCISNADYDLV